MLFGALVGAASGAAAAVGILPVYLKFLNTDTNDLAMGFLFQAVTGAALGYGAMWTMAGAYRALTGQDGLGGGDAKLVAACGAWLGWVGVPLMLAFGATAATLAFAVLALWRGRAVRAPLPFGPWLSLGALASALWGEPFLGLWLYPGG